ncbi:siderophore biosynthesis protein [Psychrobacter sp. CCUG 69069]|uniref:IucA/IucC family protein n=1 Tax=Psychrobacter namhaensis TaxID=292734 RepID=A0ABW8L8B8_9GAMM|nr:IucA/IucC family protein [Psychrobacter sp. CCUG 69069]MCD1279071.1 siderophore biosynthesis protein [Psychrobacter sp. CCUG 69069]
MMQQKTLDRLTLQNLVNAYCYETGRGKIMPVKGQDLLYKQISQDKPVLVLNLAQHNTIMAVPVDRVSQLGQHRFADTPSVLNAASLNDAQSEPQWLKPSAVSLASFIIEDIVHQHKDDVKLDGNGVLKRWLESYEGLQTILAHRSDELDDIIDDTQDFIQTEQSLIYGHAMHPTPKGRAGFYGAEWAKYAPETNSKTQLNYWLVHPDYIVEEFVDGDSITAELKTKLLADMSDYQRQLINQYPNHKLLPLHPWQATFLQQQVWYQALTEKGQLFDLGGLGWHLHPTTSVRTLAAFEAPWMFKLSLSVAITNSVRINLPKECKRGMHACRIWRSDYGKQLGAEYDTIAVLNDPAWIALSIDGKIIDETICILRDNPFTQSMQVTNLASLSQDHPTRLTNRFATLFASIHQRTGKQLDEIATEWFDTYLKVGFIPLIHMYYQHGIGFEVHQQNSLIELKEGYPAKFWARDNQGFGYIAEYAMPLIDAYPELISEGECVIPEDFADSRVAYYLVGNTVFGLITAIARTQLVSEATLLATFRDCLEMLDRQYPHRSLFDLLLRSPTLPFKGNLLTRLHALDELTAPVETQSIYVDIPNPMSA